MPPVRKNESLIGWTTITYRSVIMVIVAIVTAILIALYFMFPDASRSVLHAMGNAVAKLGLTSGPKAVVKAGPQQANFTAIDGYVRVKKASSNTWVNADSNLPLEKGDVVQTGSDGIARIVFADGSNYVIKSDSLIVIEENSMNQQQQTDVKVQVTTGTVDLATATYSSGSRSAVTMAGATANFGPDSSAQVRNDPKDDRHEFLLKKGSGEVVRGAEKVAMSDYDRVAFTGDPSIRMTKTKEIAPPVLIAPSNMAPLFSAGPKDVDFNWSAVPTAKLYRVRISKNPYFSSTVLDKKVPLTQVRAPSLPEGAYYWVVQSVDDSGRESVESEKNRFTIVSKAAETAGIALELQPFVQHGHIIEIRGKTEPNARVMVNGTEVPDIHDDGTFQFFTQQLPDGENLITVTAQNTRGGVATKQKKVVIQ